MMHTISLYNNIVHYQFKFLQHQSLCAIQINDLKREIMIILTSNLSIFEKVNCTFTNLAIVKVVI